MKQRYESPVLEIESFLFEDILTSSGLGIGSPDETEDTLEDEE